MNIKKISLKTLTPYLLIIGSNTYLSKTLFISPSHFLFLTAIAIFIISFPLKIKTRISKFDLYILVFIVLYLAHTISISIINTSFISWARENIGIILLFIFIFILSTNEGIKYERMLYLLIFSIYIPLAIDIFTIYNIFSNDLFLGYNNIELMYEIKKSDILYLDTNFSSIATLSLLVLLIENKNILKNNKITFVLLTITSLLFLIFLYSRAAIIAFILYLFIRKLSNTIIILLSISVILLLCIYLPFYSHIHLDYSLESKFEILSNSKEYISMVDYADIIFGKGAEYSTTAFNIIRTGATGSHLLFVTLLVNYGIIGLLLYILLIIRICINSSIRNFLLLLFIVSLSMLPVAFPVVFLTLGVLSKKNEKQDKNSFHFASHQ